MSILRSGSWLSLLPAIPSLNPISSAFICLREGTEFGPKTRDELSSRLQLIMNQDEFLPIFHG